MKKAISVLLACVLSLGILTGCGKQEPIETVEEDGEYFFNITAEDFKKRWNDFEGNQDSQIGEWEVSSTDNQIYMDFSLSSEMMISASNSAEIDSDKLMSVSVGAETQAAYEKFDIYADRLMKCCGALSDEQIQKVKQELYWDEIKDSDKAEWNVYIIDDIAYSFNTSLFDDETRVWWFSLHPHHEGDIWEEF